MKDHYAGTQWRLLLLCRYESELKPSSDKLGACLQYLGLLPRLQLLPDELPSVLNYYERMQRIAPPEIPESEAGPAVRMLVCTAAPPLNAPRQRLEE